MSWHKHADMLTTKLRLLAATLNCPLIPLWLKEKIYYYALFYSHLSNVMLVWETTSNKSFNRLEMLQKEILPFLENIYDHPKELPMNPIFIRHYIRLDRSMCSSCYYSPGGTHPVTQVDMKVVCWWEAHTKWPKLVWRMFIVVEMYLLKHILLPSWLSPSEVDEAGAVLAT